MKAAANGFHGQLRIALSDGITPSRLPALLALCRQEEPEVEIRFFEVPLSQQIKGLHDDLYDVGFARADEAGDGITATPVWRDPLMVAVPARHPLLAHKRICWKNYCATRWCCATRSYVRAMRGRWIVCCAVWTWNRWWPSGWRPAT
ncbi:Transcriptional regulator, LysR family [plant metagenome]|uniref:Transcriptional regulator, LysR family n=1 Tax=plant metagenome TaxID=1297885 RepID=A0A484S5Q3_9ZZZZ